MSEDVKTEMVKVNAEGKIQLLDGLYVPNIANTTTIKERVEKYYAKKNSQFYLGNDDEDDLPSSLGPHTPMQHAVDWEGPSQRRVHVECELEFKKREEILEIKQLKLEHEERKRQEWAGKGMCVAHVLDMLEQLMDEELAAVRMLKAGFQ